jgi:thiazole synthase
LLVGTGKYSDYNTAKLAIEESGAEIVTVAIRRVPIDASKKESVQSYIDPNKYTYLPNTAGCKTAEDACRVLRLAKQMNGWNLVKLEVIDTERMLYPNMPETLKAAEMLVDEGFEVMVYCSDDPVMAALLEQIGCVAIMPLASPIGSGLGIQNPFNIRAIVEQSEVPVLVDAGIGTASDAVIAMELGCDGVLLNTAIAGANNPIEMARAMKLAVESGRAAYLSGRMEKRTYAMPSSPTEGIIGE